MHQQRGQTLLIVILVIIVVSTIGLSLASRTITSLKSSTEEAESQKALFAAEAGIERAIKMQAQEGVVIISSNGDIGNNSNYEAAVTQFASAASFLLNGGTQIKNSTGTVIKIIPNIVQKDEGVDVWFAEHKTDDGSINYATVKSPTHVNLYWGTTSESCTDLTKPKPAAIEAIVVAGTSAANAKSYRYVYDSCSRGNNFKSTTLGSYPDTVSGISKMTFSNRTPDLDLANGIGGNIILIRIIPIYKDTIIGISACAAPGSSCTTLPSPGSMIDSTGTSGQASSRITEFKAVWPQTYLPYLSYGLFVAN